MDQKNTKLILDACCGGRMFWFNKMHPNALFVDVRRRPKGFMNVRPNFSVEPDEVGDFRDLKYPDGSFKMVVWDPPHTIRPGDPEGGVMAMRYGRLKPESWAEDLRQGFKECYRVLEDYGTLIFKWNSKEKTVREVLSLFPVQPLFGHTTDNRNLTHWFCFMKIPA